MAEKKKYNSILISGRKDETLTYSKFIKDEESGESVKESLDNKVNITDELETQQIKDGAITNEKMAADSVGNTNLQDGSVSNEKLEDGSITNEKLAENSITKDKLKDNTIGVEKLDPELRQTINAATGLPENLVETIQNVDDTLKDHQSQLDDKQSQIDDKQQQITSNDEDISLLQTRSTQMEETIKSIAATGGASQAAAVTYNNEKSKLTAVNIQSAVDEVVDKVSIKDEEGTVVETPFRYIQSEEFIFAKVDVNDRLLFGIQWDGTPEFGKTSAVEDRLQAQVNLLADKITTILGDDDTTSAIDTLKELKDFFANIDNTQTLTSILANLNSISTKLGEDIKNLQDKKVDKEEGKSLIEDEVKECFRVIENEEFIHAVIDSKSRLLFGIYRDSGKPYFPQNDMYQISQSEEFLWVILDTANHPLLGIQQDGTCWAANAQWLNDIKAIKEALSSINETIKTFQPKEDGKGLINLDVAESFFYISNDEYIIAVVDVENRILAGIKYDGKLYFPLNEMYHVEQNEEFFAVWIDDANHVLLGIRRDGQIIGEIHAVNALKQVVSQIQSDLISFQEKVGTIDINLKELLDVFSLQDNDEYLAVEQDAEGKVLSATNHDGSHYLYKVKSETIPTEFEHIEDHEGRTEITTDAENKILGYRDSEGTRHEHKISAKHLELSSEAAKEVNEAFKSAGIKMENPSDFSKDSHIELPIPRIAAQVRIYAPKLPTTKQDDIEAEIEYNDKDGNYFRKPVILNAQGSSSMGYYVKNMAIDISDGSEIKFGDFPTQDSFHLKKYYIDAFRGQCIVGYWLMEQVYKSHPIGQQYPYEYSYSNESTTDSLGDVKKDFFTGAKCHPDGFPIIITWVNSKTNEETWMGVYTWNLKKSKEVYFADKKKAKNIILDGDMWGTLFMGTPQWTSFEVRNPKSLKDIDENKYDGDNPKELSNTDILSKEVKGYITRLSQAYTELNKSKTKETFEKYFMPKPFIDYWLTSQVLYNLDGFGKNWIWCTWDGNLWTPTMYDVDSIFGMHWNGTYVVPGSDKNFGNWNVLYLDSLYADEIKLRYRELRDKNVFSVSNICSLLDKWINSIGYDNYKKEFKKYNDTPSYRSSKVADGWQSLGYASSQGITADEYTENKEYAIGDICIYQEYAFKATKVMTSVPPLTGIYPNAPKVLGFYNSKKRVENWLTNKISSLDTKYEYNV